MFFNFYLVRKMIDGRYRKPLLIFGVSVNVAILGYFKYTDFLIENFNFIFDLNAPLQNIILPLAISYFTFQQIAFIVDGYRGETKEYNFLNYCLFISFFPQLLMGPIVHHKEMMPQFEDRFKLVLRQNNVALGLFIFAIGLAKKTLLGDPLTEYGQTAFDLALTLNSSEAWFGAISYVLAYYFDLSGYADMAIGVAKMFNIELPINFNSPYKSRNFAEYWRRWHMSLSRFLGDYVYKSFRGDKSISYVFYLHIFLTFIVSGIWHGAGWTFLVWGIVNGIFVIMSHAMHRNGIALNFYLAWFLTFIGVIYTRVLFVANDFEDAWSVILAMSNIVEFSNTMLLHIAENMQQTIYILIGLSLAFFTSNSLQIAKGFKLNIKYSLFTAVLISASFLTLSKSTEFLYFQF